MSNEDYRQWLIELKGKIRSAQIKAALAVNQQLILLYWELGKTIAQKENVWGSKLLENISSDLKMEFPDTGGFSVRNLKYCKQFYNYFSLHQQFADELDKESFAIGQQLVAQIPWGHITLLISKVKDINAAIFYMQQTIQKGWSRDWLLNAIKMDTYKDF